MNWVVFDYGGVISKPTAALPELASIMGAPVPEFTAAYWANRSDYDAGAADRWFWESIATAVGVDGVDEALSARLTELDVEGWLDTEPATLELLAELNAAGVPLALLSNAPTSFGRVAERQEWARHFRQVIFSGDLGLRKPFPEIYAMLTARLGVSAAECFFVDDRQENVDGANAAGLRAARWTGAGAARNLLADFL
jgi:putative hydrolase of the HAD superfamily